MQVRAYVASAEVQRAEYWDQDDETENERGIVEPI